MHSLLSFGLYYFLNSEFCLKFFEQSLHLLDPYNKCLRYIILYFPYYKDFLRLIVALCKNVFIFWYFHVVTNFQISDLCHYAQHDTQCTGKNEHHQVSLIWLHLSILKLTTLLYPYRIWFTARLIFWNASAPVIPFLFFSGTIQVYLL